MNCLSATVLSGFLLVASVSSAKESLQERIEHAARLNVTAPWQESQALLDQLESDLDQATPAQRAQVTLLEARNLALAGDCDAADSVLDPLRTGDSDAVLRLSALRLSADCAFTDWRFEEGFRYLNQGLELLPRVEDAAPRVKFLAVAAYYHSQAGEPETGVEYGTEALSLAEMAGDPRLECVARYDLTLAAAQTTDAESVLDMYRRTLDSCETAGDPVSVGLARAKLGETLLDIGNIEEAGPLIRRGLQEHEESGYRNGILSGRLKLARLLLAEGDASRAETIVRPLVEEFSARKHWPEVAESYRLLALIAETRDDWRAALEHRKAAEGASQRFLDRDRAMRLAFLQVQFDTRRKEQQIALLSERNRVLELQEQTQRQQRYIAAGGITALSVIGALLLLLLLQTRSDRRRLLRLSQRDSLTGLYNHTNFFRRAGKALESCSKEDRPFTLLLADIDHFKAVNDRLGHVVGDRALRQVGKCFQAVFEPGGSCGRIGGEEFAVALPETDCAQARELVERFNRQLVRVAESGDIMSITMSYGLAEAQDGISLERLRQLADDALYEAKRRGRDCTVVATEMPE